MRPFSLKKREAGTTTNLVIHANPEQRCRSEENNNNTMAVYKSSLSAFPVVLALFAALAPNSIAIETGSNGVLDHDSSSTTPNLPFGDINVVVLTDVHSWVRGIYVFSMP